MNLKQKKIFYPIFAVLFFLVIAVVVAQAAGTPGSTNDPLVTKSYVDQQIAQLAAKIGSSGTSGGGTVNNADVEQLKTDVGDLTKFVIDSLTDIENLKSRVAGIENGYVVLQMNKGQKLILSGGSEVVLRSGSATAIKGESGTLVDISTGTDLTDGAKVPLQHLVITPKGDGRGLTITSSSYLIVKGGYSIK